MFSTYMISSTLAVPEVSAVPKHIAIIMDGNGRWANQRFLPRVAGHNRGLDTVRKTVENCVQAGVKYLTLFAFSSENWRRPTDEVNFLMSLFLKALDKEVARLNKNNIRLRVIGDLQAFSDEIQERIQKAETLTAENTGLTLVLALSYSGKWDLVQATQALAKKVAAGELKESDIDADLLASHLSTAGMPDPDLMIRTGGDHRISNFMLWQLAYAELYIFEDLYWPDFRKLHLHQAIVDFQMRERRFGKTSEQVKSEG